MMSFTRAQQVLMDAQERSQDYQCEHGHEHCATDAGGPCTWQAITVALQHDAWSVEAMGVDVEAFQASAYWHQHGQTP